MGWQSRAQAGLREPAWRQRAGSAGSKAVLVSQIGRDTILLRRILQTSSGREKNLILGVEEIVSAAVETRA